MEWANTSNEYELDVAIGLDVLHTFHRERLAGPGLAVCKYAHLVPIQATHNHRLNCIEYLFLRGLQIEHSVKLEARFRSFISLHH
jgi:hypothetical protein